MDYLILNNERRLLDIAAVRTTLHEKEIEGDIHSAHQRLESTFLVKGDEIASFPISLMVILFDPFKSLLQTGTKQIEYEKKR